MHCTILHNIYLSEKCFELISTAQFHCKLLEDEKKLICNHTRYNAIYLGIHLDSLKKTIET
jgi:hypothetical protein